MKVLQVVPSYEPAWAFGGTVTATSNLCRALAKKGIDVTVYTTNADGKGGYLGVPLNESVDLGGVKVWYFHCDLFPKKAFYSRGLVKKLDETIENFDLVDMSAMWQFIQVSASKICREHRKPYIVTPHGSLMNWGLKRKRWKRLPYWFLFLRKTLIHAAALRFVSRGEMEMSNANLKHKIPSFIVPNPIDCEKFSTDFKEGKKYRQLLNINENNFVISFLALIRPRKGLHLLIEALPYLKKEVIILIGGNIGDKAYWCRINDFINKKNLISRIKWIGEVPLKDLPRFYASSDLFALPSYEEAFGMVAVEAMTCGTPVIISKKVPIWKEILLDKAGFLVELNPLSIAKVVNKLVFNKNLLREYSKNARKSAEQRYDINKVADLMIKAYEDVLTGRRSPELQWM